VLTKPLQAPALIMPIGTATQLHGYNAPLCSYKNAPGLTISEVKVDCGKNANWLLFG